MSKRKLSKQQQTRIQQQQAESEGELATVVANYGRQLELSNEAGKTCHCTARANIKTLVAGDRVRVSDEAVVIAQEPRHTELLRPDNYGRLKPVAANVEQVLIVIAPEPPAHANLIDRYMVAIAASGMDAVIVLNKTDLLGAQHAALSHLLAGYEKLGVPVLRASCAGGGEGGDGLRELEQQLADTTSVLVGQSGVGKSSLVNALLAEQVAAVGELSAASGNTKGRHTTTTARLHRLPHGGQIIDSPGIREFQLWHIEPEQVIAGFPDLAELAQQCKFRNCAHQAEKGCCIRQARRKHAWTEQRWASYSRIITSLQSNERG